MIRESEVEVSGFGACGFGLWASSEYLFNTRAALWHPCKASVVRWHLKGSLVLGNPLYNGVLGLFATADVGELWITCSSVGGSLSKCDRRFLGGFCVFLRFEIQEWEGFRSFVFRFTVLGLRF